MNKDWEQLLNINTEGDDDGLSDLHHHRYEPTPYGVLERLLDSGYLNHAKYLIDIGCGKGRIPIFFAQTLGIPTIGIDFDEKLIRIAQTNRLQAKQSDNIQFIYGTAEDYIFTSEDAIYFFNPFSLKIFQKVLAHIIQSYYEHPRLIRLFFYYMDDDMLAYMMMQNEFLFVDEIDCEDLYDHEDSHEHIMIFETYA